MVAIYIHSNTVGTQKWRNRTPNCQSAPSFIRSLPPQSWYIVSSSPCCGSRSHSGGKCARATGPVTAQSRFHPEKSIWTPWAWHTRAYTSYCSYCLLFSIGLACAGNWTNYIKLLPATQSWELNYPRLSGCSLNLSGDDMTSRFEHSTCETNSHCRKKEAYTSVYNV